MGTAHMQKSIIILVATSVFFGSNASISLHTRCPKGESQDHLWKFPVAALVAHPCSTQAYKSGVAQVFVAAAQPLEGSNADYSIAFTMPGSPEVSPLLTGTTAVVNNVADQPHPVRGKGIAAMGLLGINPIVVTTDNPSEVALVNIGTNPHRVLTVPLVDTQGKPAAALALATLQNPSKIPDVIIVNPNMTIGVAVRPLAGLFGDPGSGISMLMTALVRSDDDEKNKKSADDMRPENLVMGVFGVLPLDCTSLALMIGNPLTKLGKQVTLHAAEWLGKKNSDLENGKEGVDSFGKFFVGVEATSGATVGDGACAVAVAQTIRAPGKPVLAVLNGIVAPDAIGADTIIAARTPSGTPVVVGAYQLRTLKTTTGLDYLVVNGGVGDPASTKRCVYALPLVKDSGTLAHVHADPVTTYYEMNAAAWPVQRSFVQPPASPADLYTSTSIPARVGGGQVPGVPTDMTVSGDAVFVTLAEPEYAGIWHSQAIFDARGVITAWTAWKRTVRTNAGIRAARYDAHAGTWLVQHADSLNMTAWKKSSLIDDTVQKLAQQQGPLTHVHDVSSVAGGSELLLLGGRNYCALACGAQSAATQVWHDETLARVGTIHASTVVTDGTYTWLVVGGTQGCAVLAHADGTGLLSSNIGANSFATLKWRLLTASGVSLTAIKKLAASCGYLYVLTSQALVRITPSAANFGHETVPVVTVATVAALGGTKNSAFTDFFVEGPLAILATSVGCFKNGDYTDMRQVTLPEQARWTPIKLPYSPGPISNIMAVGPVAGEQGSVANLYVVSAALSSSQARVYRLAVACQEAVTQNSVVLLPDELTKNNRAFFLSAGDYRTKLVTDGAFLCSWCNRYGTKPAFAEFWDPDWHLWPFSLTRSINIIRGAYRGITDPSTQHIYDMIYSSALGTWLVITDAGIIAHE